MNVVYVSNEAYAQHFAVSLASLCDCNPDEEELKIYLLDTGILPETAEKLKELAADFGRILTLIPCRNLEERFPERPDTGRFDLSTLGRFFLGELLPADVKRVLYLDCDTVVQRSLHRMYKSELGGKLLAMAEEPSIYHEVKAYLGILPEDPYFNAGVMLVDLARWREEEIGKQLLNYYAEIAPYCLFQDQDAINGLLRGRIAALHPKYNFITNYYYFSYAALEVFSPAYRKIGERRFRTAKRSPAIVHYAGDERPWRQGAYNPYGRAYVTYLTRTPYRTAKPEGGKRGYLFCYHLMNLMTRFFPSFRFALGRRYVRKSAEERRRKMWEATHA